VRATDMNGIIQLTFFNKKGLSVNCYLVEEANGFILIDTTIPGCSKEILDAALKRNKPIIGIALTHIHHDHVGSLDELKQILPEVPVYISERESRLLSGDMSLLVDEPDTPIRGMIPNGIKTKADYLLKDGDRIGSLLSIEAPGHTPGSMAFLDTRNNTLIAGDAFQTEGEVAVSGYVCATFPFPALGTWNKEISIKSARKLRGFSPSLLAAGHGEMVENPLSLIDQAIFKAENSLTIE
jgi:glyoxylase-like metal-dependent hydrolase (beta-lactamase superfamily II)